MDDEQQDALSCAETLAACGVRRGCGSLRLVGQDERVPQGIDDLLVDMLA